MVSNTQGVALSLLLFLTVVASQGCHAVDKAVQDLAYEGTVSGRRKLLFRGMGMMRGGAGRFGGLRQRSIAGAGRPAGFRPIQEGGAGRASGVSAGRTGLTQRLGSRRGTGALGARPYGSAGRNVGDVARAVLPYAAASHLLRHKSDKEGDRKPLQAQSSTPTNSSIVHEQVAKDNRLRGVHQSIRDLYVQEG